MGDKRGMCLAEKTGTRMRGAGQRDAGRAGGQGWAGRRRELTVR